MRADLSVLDALRDERGIVIAPTIPTMLDAVLLISRLPRVVCITKASLWDNSSSAAASGLPAISVTTHPLPMIRRAAEAVREGRQLLIFPEGSRTAHPPVDPLHRSFAVMARAAGAPVQTVLIEADSPYLRKGWPLFRRLSCRWSSASAWASASSRRDPEAFVHGWRHYFRAPSFRPRAVSHTIRAMSQEPRASS